MYGRLSLSAFASATSRPLAATRRCASIVRCSWKAVTIVTAAMHEDSRARTRKSRSSLRLERSGVASTAALLPLDLGNQLITTLRTYSWKIDSRTRARAARHSAVQLFQAPSCHSEPPSV